MEKDHESRKPRAAHELEMRLAGWVTIAEALQGFEDTNALSILYEIDEELYFKVASVLGAYRRADNGFYHIGTQDILEIGTEDWAALKDASSQLDKSDD